MRIASWRPAAAILVIAAAPIVAAGIGAAADVGAAVRAEVAVAGKEQALDVRRIRIVEGLTPGGSYRLPAFGVRNHRGVRTAFRLVVSAGAPDAERLPRRWLRLLPTALVVDAGRSRAVGGRIELPEDAAPGLYSVVVGLRPGSTEGALLTFRVEPPGGTLTSGRRAARLAPWAIVAAIATALAVFLVRGQRAAG